jgi:hypothetical protein
MTALSQETSIPLSSAVDHTKTLGLVRPNGRCRQEPPFKFHIPPDRRQPHLAVQLGNVPSRNPPFEWQASIPFFHVEGGQEQPGDDGRFLRSI